jgi:sulfur relay (sulfurtransferase) DsrC/TusE family protein
MIGPVAAGAFAQFRSVVLGEPSLQGRLQEHEEWDDFVAAALAIAAERGLSLTAEEIEAARAAERRAWFERWI